MEENNNNLSPYDNVSFDKAKMYFGEDYVINEFITIRQPTIGEILLEFGEEEYFSMVYSLCAIPSDMKPQLWDMGIDYDSISDFELFCLLHSTFAKDKTFILLGELDISKMELMFNEDIEEYVLVDFETGCTIDSYIYLQITNYIRKMHGIVPKVEHAYNEYTKKILIDDDRQRLNKNKNKPYESQLLPLISTMLNSAGFKYKKTELKEVHIVEFMDSVKRIAKINSSIALLHGCYSGMIDTAKINKKDLDYFEGL